jgi:hypothetical protein
MKILLALFTALACCCYPIQYAHAWSDPILVTPDSAHSTHSRVVIDPEGNLHFFFANNRLGQGPTNEHWEVFHCKLSRNGERLTEDLQLSNSTSEEPFPSPLLGRDNKIHVIWEDMVHDTLTPHGIYYSRLDTDGNIEHEATLIFQRSTPKPPHLFGDSTGGLNVVWLEHDTLLYGKFDTTGQVLIPETVVYRVSGIHLWNLKACIDNLDQIHCTYRHYWGSMQQWNLGYSRVNNHGEILIEYEPLTPEITNVTCGMGSIIADSDNNLHLAYLFNEYGTRIKHYRKMDMELNTIYDLVIDTIPMSGSSLGYQDIAFSERGYIIIVMAHNYQEVDLQFKSYYYSTDGIQLGAPEVIYEDQYCHDPDVAIGEDDFWVFNCLGVPNPPPESGILYFYQDHHLDVNPDTYPSNSYDFHVSSYPNPFNPLTVIGYQLSVDGIVNLAVYDLSGRKVATLVDGWRSKGLHEVTFDGSGLASGIYYCRLNVGTFTDAGKILLIK